MKSDTAFKYLASLLLIGGLLGFMSTTENTLIFLGLFLAGLAMLVVAFTFSNADALDKWVKSWDKHGTKQ